MRASAGAITLLAGAVVVAASILGQEICQSAGRFPGPASALALVGGGLVALLGGGVLLWGLSLGDPPSRGSS